MLLTKTIKTKWNAKTKKYYENLGYKYTKMRDEFEINVDHLKDSSNEKVLLKCDYCNKEFIRPWHQYLKYNRDAIIKKDACIDCGQKKAIESQLEKYGGFVVADTDKMKKAMIKKYGVENPFQSEEIKEKIRKNNLEKYGVENNSQRKDVQEKRKATCIERYGYDNHAKSPEWIARHSGEKSHAWKGGAIKIPRERHRGGIKNRDWRLAVFAKDFYTCQCCKRKNKKGLRIELEAHHIMNFAQYKELRYEPDNGITFCQECHTKFHSIYGKKDNNKKQITEFISNYGENVCWPISKKEDIEVRNKKSTR